LDTFINRQIPMLTLLYVMDSLRPDFLGCYGDRGAMTPHLDAFAATATRYTNAYALAPWSKASGAAMFTGELPRALKMRKLTDKLPADVPTVAEQMQIEGNATVAITANPFISHDFGLLRGFDTSIEAFRPDTFPQEQFRFHHNHFLRVAESLSIDPAALVLARSEVLHHAASAYLAPDTFLMVWSMDTHAPFFVRGDRSYFGNPLDRVIPAADAEWLTDGVTVRDMVSLYQDMIAYNDDTFGALMVQIRERGLWEEALIVVTGDHGEAFGEHGLLGHTNGLWEEQVKVPLLIKFPHQATGLVENRLIGLDSIFSVISQQPVMHPDTLYLENPDGWAIRQGVYKGIAPKDDTPLSVFNLETDPQERLPLRDRDLHHALKVEAMAIRASTDTHADQWNPAPEVVLDSKLAERLRGLGYL
jgi:arylsulfatase A-like enzyme